MNSFAALEPTADGFRNYFGSGGSRSPADMLTLSVPEMTVLVGGMRALNTSTGQSAQGMFIDHLGTLSNDFLITLVDMSTEWSKSSKSEGVYEGCERGTGRPKWTATHVDLVFGTNSELRAVVDSLYF